MAISLLLNVECALTEHSIMPQHSRRLGSKIQPSTDLSAVVGMACGHQPVAKCGMCFDGKTT